MASIVGTSPQFNFSNDFLADGLAGDLYGYGMDVGLSSNQAAYNASSIAAPLGASNAALNSSLLGSGVDMGSGQSWLSKLGTYMNPLESNALGSGLTQNSAAADTLDKLKKFSIARVVTILVGTVLTVFGLYYFGSSALSSSIASLANKVVK